MSGCDQGALQDPSIEHPFFQNYVALGNSVTAGFQSAGIVDTSQQASYAALLAEQMGTPFHLPLLEEPGCPPPVQNIFLSTLSSDARNECGLRSTPLPSGLHNMAVPDARVIDALSNVAPTASPNQLTSFILGGRTQLEAARAANPTFATVWLGNNDVLDPALAGDTTLFTRTSEFQTQMTSIVDGLTGAGADRGILLGVANPLFTPHLSMGRAYYAAESQINQMGEAIAAAQGLSWGGFEVRDSCAPAQPGAETRIPFAYGFGALFLQALEDTPVQLDCAPTSAPEPLLTPAEQASVTAHVRAYNETLSALADEYGWAYVDLNPTFEALYAAGTDTPADPTDDAVPKFPNPPNLQNPSQSPPTFGRFFSEDGLHPSSATHKVITNLVIEAINSEYPTELSPVEAPELPTL